MRNPSICIVTRHLLDGCEVNAVVFWSSWHGWAHHLDAETLAEMRAALERGDVVSLGLQDFQLEMKRRGK